MPMDRMAIDRDHPPTRSKSTRKTTPLGQTCERCGVMHERCAGHNGSGQPCGLYPRKGLEVCRVHGGNTPVALEKLRRREVERQATAWLVRWRDGQDRPVTDPFEELEKIAGEVVAFKDYLRAQVDDLGGILTYWTERTWDDGTELRTQAVEELRATVAAYERALDRSARVLASIVKLDIAERMATINATKADLIVQAVRTGLSSVDIPAELRAGAADAVADALESLARPRELTA